jgi:hypothetical protein
MTTNLPELPPVTADELEAGAAEFLQPPTSPAPAGPSLRELAEDVDPEEAQEAGLPGQSIRVVLEDGTEFTVRTVNRDYIRWDKTPAARRGGVKQFQDAPFIFATFLAWSAAKRLELVPYTFDQFLELAEVVERQAATEVPPTQ